eukprot:CAMPEP_0114265172 /NCGR_PEP_ID=MMETSP0058-20121206/23723_1 /TAXON_ID=36894 /ORGANISM="Pyramimonas parkeae, CCMP726" /LENGTH=698 /DNA_ID=CAMNT_0001382145 /DNA_START=63 /DNA_END=2159 /DNA_ORIENTATION=-
MRQWGSGTAGSGASVAQRKRAERLDRIRESTQRLVVAWALASVCLVGHLAHWIPSMPKWLHILCGTRSHALLSVFALLGPGRQTLIDGWKSLSRGSPNMNTLVSLGAVASFSMSSVAALVPKLMWPTFFEEPVMLMAFVLLGRAVEERAKLQASSDMTALLNLLPTVARLLPPNSPLDGNSGIKSEVPTDVLKPGDLIQVLPGDRVPVDGVVVYGRSSVEEAAFTGSAGTINCDGTLTVEVASVGEDTMLADVVRMVEDAQARTAPVQRLADTVSGKFVYAAPKIFPAVIKTAAGAAAGGVGGSAALLLGLQLACNVLVVACPCALGLATPTAVLVGTALGARHGLLIRGGDILEKASGVDTVVLDKTGTITRGRPQVTRVLPVVRSEMDILAFAGSVEMLSSHPLAHAISTAAASAKAKQFKVTEGSFTQEAGSGARAIVGGHDVEVGTWEWVHRNSIKKKVEKTPLPAALLTALVPGHTRVYVSVDGQLAGALEIADEIRAETPKALEAFRRMGIEVHVLSGDQPPAVAAVAEQLGMSQSQVHGGVRPEGKAQFVSKLQKQGRSVAMVGDGINDAAALAQADVGIAMGGGVGAASEVASVVLLGDRLTQVVSSLELSKATFSKIKQNIGWAFAYNLVGIPLAAGAALPAFGIALTPSLAGALMGISSLGVMGNSLLLRVTGGQRMRQVDDADSSEK